MKRFLVSCLLIVALGCGNVETPPETSSQLSLDRTTVRALSDFLYAGYAIRLLRDRPEPGQSLEELEARHRTTADALREALIDAGADPASLAGDDDGELLAQVGEAVRGGGRYAIVFTVGRESFALVRIRAAEPARNVTLFGLPFRYDLIVHDETLVQDYPGWVSMRVSPQARVSQPATYSSDGTVRVDAASIQRLGELSFLPRIPALRAAAASLADDATFLDLAEPERLLELLSRVKDGLRWRSLEPLWSSVQARAAEEQLQRFVADYAGRAELRAAAELRELARLRQAGDERPLTPSERVLLHELGSLSAIVHGEPLGHTADVIALAAAGLAGGGVSPPLTAARQLVRDLIHAFRTGEPDPRGDALAIARLARAEPTALRELAEVLHAERLAQLGG